MPASRPAVLRLALAAHSWHTSPPPVSGWSGGVIQAAVSRVTLPAGRAACLEGGHACRQAAREERGRKGISSKINSGGSSGDLLAASSAQASQTTACAWDLARCCCWCRCRCPAQRKSAQRSVHGMLCRACWHAARQQGRRGGAPVAMGGPFYLYPTVSSLSSVPSACRCRRASASPDELLPVLSDTSDIEKPAEHSGGHGAAL